MPKHETMKKLKAKVMKEQGYDKSLDHPDNVKYEIAEERGIPLKKGYNGNLTAEDAGKIGGPIGGNIVKEMVRMAQQKMLNNHQK